MDCICSRRSVVGSNKDPLLSGPKSIIKEKNEKMN